MISSLNILLPEIFLSLSIFTILMFGVFIKKSFNIIFNLTSLILILTIAIILNNPNQDIEWINSTFSKSFTVTPGFTYEFSEWIDCTFYISHNIMETNTTNKKDESSVGFNLLIYFESFSSN